MTLSVLLIISYLMIATLTAVTFLRYTRGTWTSDIAIVIKGALFTVALGMAWPLTVTLVVLYTFPRPRNLIDRLLNGESK